jgi:site-specific DNA-methyltransferase (adenine-specific)
LKPYYEQDGITIYHGDALQLLASIEQSSIDLVATDPPYSSGGAYRGDRTMGTRTKYVTSDAGHSLAEFDGDNRDQRAYGYWCTLWLAECLRVTKPGGVCCLFTDWRQLPTTTDALQAGGWVWRGVVPWNKTEAARPAKGRFRNQCEYVVWGSKGPMGDVTGDDDRPCLPGFFLKYLPAGEKYHIASKPVEIMEEIVAICPTDGVVLDPFMGAGATPLACRNTLRRCIAADSVQANCDIAIARQSQGVLFGAGGAA